MANAWIIEPLPLSSVEASSSVRGPASNVGSDFAGVVWRSAQGGNASLLIDLGRDVECDTLQMFGVNGDYLDEGIVSVRLATSAQGTVFGTPSADETRPGHYWPVRPAPLLTGGSRGSRGTGTTLVAWADDAPRRVRYLYIYVEGLTALGSLQVARVVIGKRITLDRNFSFGAEFGTKDLGSLEFSRQGVLLRNRGAKLRTASLTFAAVRKDEVEALTKPLLERLGNTECVAVVTDPTPHTLFSNRCYFGPLVGDLSQTWRRADSWEAKINMVSLF